MGPGKNIKMAEKLKKAREEAGLSLRELSRLTGVAPGTIQKVESNGVSPTVSTLFKIVQGLNKEISFFLEDDNTDKRRRIVHTRKAERHFWDTQRDTLQGERIVGNVSDPLMDAYSLVLSPGEESGEYPFSHKGQELVICEKGTVTFTIAGEKYRLKKGDTLLFHSEQPHRWENHGARKAEMTLIFSPPVLV